MQTAIPVIIKMNCFRWKEDSAKDLGDYFGVNAIYLCGHLMIF
jgi:hypothetical protein